MPIKNFSPYKVVKEAIEIMKPNERKVVLGRFGINENHKTLSAIGKSLKLSRERIRQIETEALKKLAREIVSEDNLYVGKITEAFDKEGGISSHQDIANTFLDRSISQNKNEFNSLHLIFVLIPQIKKIEKTRELEEGWILSSLSKEDALEVINDWVKHLAKTKKPASLDVLIEAHPNHKKHKIAFLSQLPQISKKLIQTETGQIGLVSWPEVNPRNVRDKIHYILTKNGKPMHFRAIAQEISNSSFDKKNVVNATVHNELIADDRFVLVGRGIYALKEWGYENGTVADIIKSVLENNPKGLSTEEIIDKVLKQRLVKKNTVLINLQTKPFFKKISRNKYILK